MRFIGNLFTDQVHDQAQDGADQKAGDDGKMKAESGFLDMNVTGQTTNRGLVRQKPEKGTHRSNHKAADDHHFADFIHRLLLHHREP